jgi:hypothetical protein
LFLGPNIPSGGIQVTLAERWDGARWAVQPTPNPTGATYSLLNGVSCTAASACTAVGYFNNSVSTLLTLAERWDGTGWSIQPIPSVPGATGSSLNGVSCATPSACTAVGSSTGRGGIEVTLAEHWDGTSWSVQRTPNPRGAVQSTLYGVSCTSSTACTAVGEYLTSSAHGGTLAERWDGVRWTIQATPNPPDGSLNGVSCMSAAACTAVGSTGKTLAERWDGTSWAIQSTPNPIGKTDSYYLGGVSCTATSACTAVGDYLLRHGPGPTGRGGTEVTLAERLTASSVPTVAVAKLTGIPAACVLAPFAARVEGRGISSVMWLLDGKGIKGRAIHRGTRYAASISPSPGKHKLTVRVNFKASTNARARTLRRTVSGCPPVEPKFTG